MRTRIEGPLDVDLDALLAMLHEADKRVIDAILAAAEALDLDALLASLDVDLDALLESLLSAQDVYKS